MSNNNLVNISTFENLQNNQNAKTGISSLSVFNAFQVTVPDFVKKTDTQTANSKYQKKEEAEKLAKGWHDAKLEAKKDKKDKNDNFIYFLQANGQRYTITDKSDAEKALSQAKKSTVVEV
jgi:microcystin degradation protein MlrC